jgi:hypothetical protein
MAYELLEEEEPKRNAFEKAARQGGRALASGITGVVGGVGDLANLASRGLEKIGVASPEGAQEFREKTLTSEKLKQGFEEQFPSLKPQNKVEKFTDDVFETLGGLGTGGPGRTLGTRLLRKFGLSIGANLGKEVVDQVASEEGSKWGQYTKAGLLFLGSLINPRLARNAAARNYQEAERLLPQGASGSTTNLNRQLNAIENGITQGRPRNSLSNAENFVIDRIDRVRSLDQNGRFDIRQGVAQKRSLNEDLGNLFPQFGQEGSRTVRNQARRVTRSLNDAIDEYGASNPEYLRYLRAGDEIYGTLARANGVNTWIKQNFPHSPWSRAGLLFAENTIGQVPRMIYKAWESPEIRRLYISAIGRATAEDSKDFAKIMDQLDKKLIEDESKDQWEFVD